MVLTGDPTDSSTTIKTIVLCRCLPPTATPSSNTPSSETPSSQEGVALPDYPETAEKGQELADYLRKNNNNIGETYVPQDFTDPCSYVIAAGADLAQGDIDVYMGRCGADVAGTLYKIRGNRVVDSVSGCWKCGYAERPELTAKFKRMLAPYGERTPASFQGSEQGVLVPNVEESGYPVE